MCSNAHSTMLHDVNCCTNTVISYIFMVTSLLRASQWHPMKTMPALHVAFYVPFKEAAKGTIGALMRFLSGVDAHVPPEVISSTAGPTTNWTTQLSTLLTPRLSQRATHWLTHQHPPCFFQLQRNSLHQLWMQEALSHQYSTCPLTASMMQALATWVGHQEHL